ncbi:hypothetical protein ACGFYQ_23820 [Streptomyces sp. NPDC048258]|uniref:hypothetical protein n=1 Tax=Streptomyces sp. NPDC048258 TaxID=3365527 RepID=UPI003717E307
MRILVVEVAHDGHHGLDMGGPDPSNAFGRNHGEDINVIDDMKIKRLIAEQIGPKAPASPSAPGAASSSPGAAPPPSSPPPSPAPAAGGGIPCVD